MNVSNLNKYKRSKIIVRDLTEIIKVMNLSITALSHFIKYIPIMESVSVLQNNKTLLEIHLNKQKKILKSKGLEE